MKAKLWQEIRSLSNVELESRLHASKEQLFRLKFKHAATPLKNGLEIRKIRRMIAQFETLIQEKAAASKQPSK